MQAFELPTVLSARSRCFVAVDFAFQFDGSSVAEHSPALVAMCVRSMTQSTMASTPLRSEPSLRAMAAVDDYAQVFPGMRPRTYLSHRGNGGRSLTRITDTITEWRDSNHHSKTARIRRFGSSFCYPAFGFTPELSRSCFRMIGSVSRYHDIALPKASERPASLMYAA